MTRDTTPFELAVLARDAVPEPDDGEEELPPRQCGRCRMMFDGDPALDIRVRNDWCLCPACEATLLPGRARRSNIIEFRRPTVISAESPAADR